MTKWLFVFILCMNAYALDRKPKGEYIITTKELSEKAVRKSLQKYPPDELKSLGNGQYSIKYKKDPGLEALKKSAGKTFEIQPNFVYKSLK